MADFARRAALSAGAALLFFSSSSLAEPNISVAATIGGGAAAERGSGGVSPAFHLGLRGDAMFLRERDSSMGVGPYVEFVTSRVATAELGGGGQWLLPLFEHLPIVLSAGGFLRRSAAPSWEPGLAANLFAGSKSHNFHGIYGVTAGLFLQGRMGLGDSRQGEIILGAHIDTALLALPFVLAYNAIRP